MIKEATTKLINHENLTPEEAAAVMNEIMNGETSQVQTAAYLAALSTKGETIDEIAASAEVMRSHASTVEHADEVLEIVGTGGDGAKSFNISTTAAIVLAAGGVKVAKHGNRAASSKSGTADCLEALGVNISLTPEACTRLLEETGICFLFAQKYHTSMKYVGPVRKELGVRTVFNILGPITNPANANYQLLGVYSEDLVEPLAHVLSKLGVKRGLAVYGQDCLDEISISSSTTVCEFEGDEYHTYVITPEDFGLKTADKSEIVGGTPEENAGITRDILEGKLHGAKRDIVLLNAGAAFYITGTVSTLKEGIDLAATVIDDGRAAEKLEQFIEASNKYKE